MNLKGFPEILLLNTWNKGILSYFIKKVGFLEKYILINLNERNIHYQIYEWMLKCALKKSNYQENAIFSFINIRKRKRASQVKSSKLPWKNRLLFKKYNNTTLSNTKNKRSLQYCQFFPVFFVNILNSNQEITFFSFIPANSRHNQRWIECDYRFLNVFDETRLNEDDSLACFA